MAENKPTLWRKLKFFGVTSVGFFADGYLNLTIGVTVQMLGYIYFSDTNNALPTTGSSVIKAMFSTGMIFGMLTFGILGDTIGRHKIYGRELFFTIFGALMCILLPWRGMSHTGVVAWMAAFRFTTGFGVGGDYPMSTALAAEKGVLKRRALSIMLVTFAPSLGSTACYTMFLILLAGFKTRIQDNIYNLNFVWRLLIGLGIIPCIATVYFRLIMRETKPYEQYVQKINEDSPAAKPRHLHDQFHDFRIYFAEWRHALALLSVCAVWFLTNMVQYGISLNQPIILANIGFASGKTSYENLWNTATGALLVQGAGYLPGHFSAIFLPDIMGRRAQQLVFSFLTMIIYAAWTGVTGRASSGTLIALLTLAQLFASAGPNSTTILLPAELFPTRVRGTAHGIASASGQVGAIVSAYAFGNVVANLGMRGVLGLFTGLLGLIVLFSMLIPEPRGITLEQIENDDLYRKTGLFKDRRQVLESGTESVTEEGVMVTDKIA